MGAFNEIFIESLGVDGEWQEFEWFYKIGEQESIEQPSSDCTQELLKCAQASDSKN